MVNKNSLQNWQRRIANLNVERLWANTALRQRARQLASEDVCSFIVVNELLIVAQVRGRTGKYMVKVMDMEGGLEYGCSCSSGYHPCKHVGALLYTLQNPPPGNTKGRAAAEAPVGKVAAGARFRPAFQMVQIFWPSQPNRSSLGIDPVLVYRLKNGSDGRRERFRCTTPRASGSSVAEALLRRWKRGGYKPLNAPGLVACWYRTARQVGGLPLELPVEMYLDGAGRFEGHVPVSLRRIEKIKIHWRAKRYSCGQIEFCPHFELQDARGFREYINRKKAVCDEWEGMLLLANLQTGSLWYLDGGGKAAELFRLPELLGRSEVSAIIDRYSRCAQDLIEIERSGLNVELVSVLPTPVLDIEGLKGSAAAGRTSLLSVHFRYGEQGSELPPGSTDLIQSPAPAGSPGRRRLIKPDWKAEQHLILALMEVLAKQPFEVDVDLGPEEECFYVLAEAGPVEVLGGIGEKLLCKGFELRLRGAKVRRPPGKYAVRVASSGEQWLDIEAGFELENGFVPIKDIPARGVARAEGRLYVLPAGADTEALSTALRNRRVGIRELAMLEKISGLVSNPEHPALVDFFDLRRRLHAFSKLEETEVPAGLQGELRPYQKSGLAWLWFLHRYRLGGCLADDMGLGKTIQTLAVLAKAREAGEMRRALVVCPVSTLGNWLHEIATFTPLFTAAIHAGPQRARHSRGLRAVDIILVSYATLLRDVELFRELEPDYLILDEAQAIKNPKAKRRKALASISAPHRLALTGTPMENGTVELWSLFDFLMPGIFGSRRNFSRRYGGDDSCDNSESKPEQPFEALRRILRPLLLRRTKSAVAPELPLREEQLLYCTAGRRQARMYESLRLKCADEADTLMRSGLFGEAALRMLLAMLRLRQAAILPALVDAEFSDVPSAKMELLYDRLIELSGDGHKALVFSQFTAVLDELSLRLAETGIRLFRLDGSTPHAQRDAQIAGFQTAESSAVFLISLKAGGVGINLTAADYVFLIDPWWNPAVEAQAVDRAHRIGRKGTVFVYRLITAGTIEEKILRLQHKKRSLTEAIVRGESGRLRELSADDIRSLFEAVS